MSKEERYELITAIVKDYFDDKISAITFIGGVINVINFKNEDTDT